ncbi:TPA: hypothetical protein N0F65_012230 [Lagenidium giganteum]|uniref:TrmE-type G domain-containing protein n=1 Tax=Lagenidium giganteum TaxID=4803 RepID=A0AAV2ZID6_9STRA|nr:TPA: hypothetical protein N0F65_012230 [Lagenidium giganteum]
MFGSGTVPNTHTFVTMLLRSSLRRWRQPRAVAALSLDAAHATAARCYHSAEKDTIYALSSAEGKAGVAVVRISGDMADQCLRAMSKSSTLPAPRSAAFRKLYHPVTKQHLDDALAIRFPQPRSFTGEDVVELHVHGSHAVVTGILEALSHVPTCRAAEPGEFTERAFDNQKIDLMQVEGLADLLSAETEAQRAQALRQLSGDIGDVYEQWRTELVKCLAYTEAMIDFGDDEDDVTDAAYDLAIDRVQRLVASIRSHLADGRRGEILRNGVQVAILGPPNAGKSSLLNVLARRPAAIVSAIAGTTRDIVQVPLNIAGFPVLVSDTAGMRDTDDVIEQEGVSRARQCADSADVRVVMMDVQSAADPAQLQDEIYSEYLEAPDALIVLNKSDTVEPTQLSTIVDAFEPALRQRLHVISCAQGEGIDVFIDALGRIVKEKLHSSNNAVSGAIITRERHRQNLVACVQCLEAFLENPYQAEIAAEDLRRAVVAIGRILGRVDVEDVLDVLMMEFLLTEVFANDVGFLQEALGDNSSKREPEEGDGANGEDPKNPAFMSRKMRNSQHIPQLPDKGCAFESFTIVPDRGIFGGRHDGKILFWKIHSTPFGPPPSTCMSGHLGSVLALEFCYAWGREGLLFSGSADRNIRVWDPAGTIEAQMHPSHRNQELFCVQTINAHDASVTSLKIMTQQKNGLVSCSLDHTVKVWYPADGRGLLLYPWFLPAQTITSSSGNWPTSLCLRDGAACSLFVGDSTGCISLYTCGLSLTSDDNEADATSGLLTHESAVSMVTGARQQYHFKLKRKHSHFHTLRISALQLVADNSFVVSLGFDQKAQVIDAISGALSSTIVNTNPARFTSCSWDARGQLLFLSDAVGYVQVWNIFQDKRLKNEQLFPHSHPILTLCVGGSGSDMLFAGIPNCLKQWRINRDVGYKECTGHTEAVVCLAILPDERDQSSNSTKATAELDEQAVRSTSTSRFFSASLDNTVRCWDSYDMKVSYGFEEKQSKITCMLMSKKFNKLITGHEQGFVKSWGVLTGHCHKASIEVQSAVTCLASGIIRDQEFILAGDVDGVLSVFELQADGLTLPSTIGTLGESEKRDDIIALWFDRGEFLEGSQQPSKTLSSVPQFGREFVVIGYNSGSIAIWNVTKRLQIHRWKAHDDVVTSLVMHGCFLFSGSEDTSIRIWNLFELEEAYQLQRLQMPASVAPFPTTIACLDVVEDSAAIFSATVDGNIVLWDYTTYEDEHDFKSFGKVLFRTRHDSHIRCLKYWPALRSVVVGTNEGKILVFDLPPQAAPAAAPSTRRGRYQRPTTRAHTATAHATSKRTTEHSVREAMACAQTIKFAVIGDSFVDVVAGTLAPEQLPKWGGDVECSLPIEMQPGGSALNTATHLANIARLHPTHRLQVELHTVVGTDAFADVLKHHLSSHGIRLSSPGLKNVPTGVCIVLSGVEDRSFVTHYGAVRKFAVEHIDEERVLSANHMHIGGYYSCSDLQAKLAPLLKKARERGITISLDTNYDTTEKWEGLTEILPLVDVFLPNELEAMNLSRCSTVEDAFKFFQQHVPGLVVIKVGEGGARAVDSKTGASWFHPSFKSAVVDVTGAGDSFNSGFLSAWKASNGDVAHALKWGCATASKCVSALGACSFSVSYQDIHEVILNDVKNV